MITYITSLYSVRKNYLPTLYEEFQKLMNIGVPIIVWCEENLPFPIPKHVRVLLAPLNSFYSYTICSNPTITLPKNRNPEKDTQEFMALMNTKVEMIWRSLPYVQSSHIAWIDAAIFKIFKDIPRAVSSLINMQEYAWPDNVCLPGCWKTQIVNLHEFVCWRFCGGFFVCPTSFLPIFYEKVTRHLESWIQDGHIAWEVNIWADLEKKDPHIFSWWFSLHDECMLEPKLLKLPI